MQHTDEETAVVMKAMTAEVQTIMMNNRQVTLSVARQLDRVPLFMMEPWGRVSLLSGGQDGQIVIGVSDGQLVTAKIPDEKGIRERPLFLELQDPIFLETCPDVEVKHNHIGQVDVYVDNAILRILSRQLHRHECHKFAPGAHQQFRVSCHYRHLDALLQIAAYQKKRETDLALIHKAQSLPKIVLAGLK